MNMLEQNPHNGPTEETSSSEYQEADYKTGNTNDTEDSNSQSRTSPSVYTKETPPARVRYKRNPELPKKIVESLARGTSAEDTAKILDIPKSQVNLYKNVAMRMKVLTEIKGCYPKFYEKGPRFHLRNERGWWSRKFEPILCRVHGGQGSPYSCYVIDYTHFEYLPYHQKDGTVLYQPLFKNHIERQGYVQSNCNFPVPEEVFEKARYVYLEVRAASRSGVVTLYVGPRPIERTFQELEAIACEDDPDPFKRILSYVEEELLRHGYWRLDEFRRHAPIHYPIDRSIVECLCPELLKGVPKLKRGDNEEELVIYVDKSTSSGELETTSSRVARDILGILEVERRTANGVS